jgi:TP901 family phage tail tape measure protein
MPEDIDLGTLAASVKLDLSQLRTARNQAARDLSDVSAAMEKTAKSGEGSARRTEAAWRDASGKMRDHTGRYVKDMNAGADSVVASFAKLAVGAKVLHLIGTEMLDAANLAGNFERSMNVLGQVSGATTEQLESLRQTARQLGADMSLPNTSSLDAASAMLELSKAGLSVEQSMAAAKGSLQLAAAAQISAGEAAKITANALNTFGLSGSEANRVADILAATANSSSGEITDFAAAFQQAGAAAATLKIPVEDAATALALMAKNGVLGSDAGTSLKAALTQLSNPTAEATRVMDHLNIKLFDSHGRFVGLQEAAKRYERATGDLTDQQKLQVAQTLAGTDGYRALLFVMGAGDKVFAEQKKRTEELDAAQKSAKAQADGYKGSIDGLKSAFDSFKEETAADFLSVLTAANRGAAEGIKTLSGYVAWLKEFRKEIRNHGTTDLGFAYHSIDGAPKTQKAARESAGRLRNQVGVLEDELYRRENGGKPRPLTRQEELRGVLRPTYSPAERMGIIGNAGIDANTPPERILEIIRQKQEQIGHFDRLAAKLAPQFGPPAPKRTSKGSGAPPKTDPVLAGILAGEKADDAKRAADKAKRDAERLAASVRRASEIRADASAGTLSTAYNDLRDRLRDNIRTLPQERIEAIQKQLGALSKRVAEAEKRAAGVKRDNADPLDRPAAQAEYEKTVGKDGKGGEVAERVRNRAINLTKTLADEQTRRKKKQQDFIDDGLAQVSRGFTVWHKLSEKATEERVKLDKKAADDAAELSDLNLKQDIENGRVALDVALRDINQRMAGLDKLSERYRKLEAMREATATMLDRKVDAAVDQLTDEHRIDQHNGIDQANARQISNTDDEAAAAARAQVKTVAQRLGQNPFGFIAESMKANADLSITYYESVDDAVNGIMSGTKDLVIDTLAQIAAAYAAQQIGGMFGGPLGSAVGSIFGTGLKSIFRAEGGPVEAGHPYIVGEKRPELFVPRVPGVIVPQVPAMGGQGGGGGGGVIVHLGGVTLAQNGMTPEQLAHVVGQHINRQIPVARPAGAT